MLEKFSGRELPVVLGRKLNALVAEVEALKAALAQGTKQEDKVQKTSKKEVVKAE